MLDSLLKLHTTSSLWRPLLGSLRQYYKHSHFYGLQRPDSVTNEVGCQPPPLAPLKWSYPRPLWWVRRTRTPSVLTPRSRFVLTLQTHIQVYLHFLSLHNSVAPLHTCSGWILCRVGRWGKMKPTILPYQEQLQYLILIVCSIPHGSGLLVSQVFLTANSGFLTGYFPFVNHVPIST